MRLIALALSLAGILLSACGSDEPATASAPGNGPDSARRAAFSRDLIALKAENLDEDVLDARTRALLARHGYPVPALERATPVPITETAGGGLPKASAGSWETKDYLAKDRSGDTYYTHRNSISLGAGEQIGVRVDGVGSTDPFLAVYYEGATPEEAVFVISEDDSSGLSLDIAKSWVNNTGSTKTLHYVVFAARTTTRGTAKVRIWKGATLYRTETDVTVGGTVRYSNTHTVIPGSSCSLLGSRFWLASAGAGYTEDILALNHARMKGLKAQMNNPVPTAYSVHIPSGEGYDKDSPNGDEDKVHHWVLAYKPTKINLSGTWASDYRYIQYDQYFCF